MARKAGNRRLGRGLGSLIQTPVKVDVPDEEHSSADGSREENQASAVDLSRTQAASLISSAAEQEASGHPPSEQEWVVHDEIADESADQPVARMLDMASVRPNPNQPRRNFDQEALQALADSIRSAGLMQPIVVRPDGTSHQIIAGERRWRAAQIVGLDTIPAVIHDVDDRQVAEWSLVENLQREDLNAIEKAQAFQRLSDEFELTHQQIAEAVGLHRASVTNHIRLLELDPTTLEMVEKDLLTLGHARALLSIGTVADRQKLAAKSVREGWSVRSIEREIRKLIEGPSTTSTGEDREAGQGSSQPLTGREAHLRDLEKQLGDHLGTRVKIKPGRKKGAGTLQIEFYDNKQFEGLLERMHFSSY